MGPPPSMEGNCIQVHIGVENHKYPISIQPPFPLKGKEKKLMHVPSLTEKDFIFLIVLVVNFGLG